MVLFCGHSKWQNTIINKNRGFSRHRGKPKMALLVAKLPFWEGAPKGFYYLWFLKAVLCCVFSRTQLCRHERVKLDNNKNLTKIGVVSQNAKGVFCFGHFFGFGGFVFLVSLCFCAFALCTIAQNGYFLAFLEVFCLFCSHKWPVLIVSFLPVLFFLLLSSLSKIHFFFAISFFGWKHYKNNGFGTFTTKRKRPTINKIVELKICPRLRWKSVQLCCAT